MKRFFNSCGRYRRSICLLAGGALPEPEKDQIENHLAGCADCRKYYDEMQAVTVPLTNWERAFYASATRAGLSRTAGPGAVHAAGRTEPVRRLTPGLRFPRMVAGCDPAAPPFLDRLGGGLGGDSRGKFLSARSFANPRREIFTDVAGNGRIVQRPAKNSGRVVDGSFRAARCGTAEILSTGTPNGKHDDIDCLNLS